MQYKAEAWNLKDILLSHDKTYINQCVTEINKEVKDFESKKIILTKKITAKELLAIIKSIEGIKKKLTKLTAYADLWFYADTKCEEARVLQNKMNQYAAEVSNKMLFFSHWFKSLDEETAKKLSKGVPEYTYFLDRIRMFKPYTLTEAEEKIINIKDVTEKDALNTLYEIMTSAFTYEMNIKGKKVKLNKSEISAYARNKDGKLREQAYRVTLKKFAENKDVIGEIYKILLNSWKNENLQLRKYKHAMSPRNLGNNISDKTIDTMLEVCQENAKVFQVYFRKKAKLLKEKKLAREHIYAPIGAEEKNIPYNEAVQLVLDAYASFSPEIAALAQKIIQEKHVDARLTDAKRGGAFCYDLGTELTPYVLLNYTGKERDVSTLAHELGHGVHDLLSHKQPLLLSHPPLVLAETASVFGEMILMERLFSLEKDKKKRQILLAARLDDLYATITRQAFFVLFEKQAHQAMEEGATIEELSQLWHKSLQEQFGESVEVTEHFKHEWLTIPHIFETPFYCYAYCFGNLLTLALYQMYKEEGKSFVPKYIKFLSYGGSAEPKKICAELGIDLESKEFWQKGFNFIQTLVDELEA